MEFLHNLDDCRIKGKLFFDKTFLLYICYNQANSIQVVSLRKERTFCLVLSEYMDCQEVKWEETEISFN